MSSVKFETLGIGNAIVDVIAQADDAFLKENDIAKGGMTLIDADQATTLYGKMPAGIEISGGSAANTIAGIASLGGQTAYIGKTAKDQLGEVFAHDIRATGVTYETAQLTDGTPTARCLILVTPDAQRSMSTFLGASSQLTPDDIDAEMVAASGIVYLEGYLFDPDHAKEAFRKAAKLAHDAGRKVALTLSDSFCVDRHRQDFQHLVEHEVDILFANENEIVSLYQTGGFDEAVSIVKDKCQIAALTRSEKGSVVVNGADVHAVPAAPVEKVVDTTGAGDLYASGFLHAMARGRPLTDCAKLGGIAAAEIISHFGARSESPLKALADKAKLTF